MRAVKGSYEPMPTLASISKRPSHPQRAKQSTNARQFYGSKRMLPSSSNNAGALPDEKDTLLIKTMPLIRYATQETHLYDQDDTSLVGQLKRNARVAVPAQAGSRPPVSNQTPLMHLYDRHPRSRHAKLPPAKHPSQADNRKPCTTPKCTARYEYNQFERNRQNASSNRCMGWVFKKTPAMAYYGFTLCLLPTSNPYSN